MFKVGDKAWIIPFTLGPIDKRGYCCTECTIVGGLQLSPRSKTGDYYTVRTYDGRELCASPRILRRSLPADHLIERIETTQEIA